MKLPHILKEFCLPFFSELEILHILLFRIIYNFIINISDVHTILNDVYIYLNIIPKIILHNSSNHIIADIITSMTHMTVWIYSRPTCVPFHIFSIHWNKLFLDKIDYTSYPVRLFLSFNPVTKFGCIKEKR